MVGTIISGSTGLDAVRGFRMLLLEMRYRCRL